MERQVVRDERVPAAPSASVESAIERMELQLAALQAQMVKVLSIMEGSATPVSASRAPPPLHGLSMSPQDSPTKASAPAARTPSSSSVVGSTVPAKQAQRIERLNIPGGVMISLNVATQAKTAQLVKRVLEKRGVQVWVCFDMSGGIDFRDEIVRAIKTSRVVVCLVNNAWANSGECKDEFSLAKRRNLTSHESGRTRDGEMRLPGIVPIAFPDLRWDQHPHVELLAANTNFLVSSSDAIEDEDSPVIADLLSTLQAFEVESAPEQGKQQQQQQQAISDASQTGQKSDAIRRFHPYKTNLHSRYIGTIAYDQNQPGMRVLFHETMEMRLTMKDDKKQPNVKVVDAVVDFTMINIEIEIEEHRLSVLDAKARYPLYAEYFDALLEDDGSKPYGSEIMSGEYDLATGVLYLDNEKTTGNACPTWRRLTVCNDGQVLVGVGGNYKKEWKPSSGQKVSSCTATRLVAY